MMAALSLDSDDPLRFASSEPIHEVALKGNIPELKRQVCKCAWQAEFLGVCLCV